MIQIRGPTDIPDDTHPQLQALILRRLTQLGDGQAYDEDSHDLWLVQAGDTAEAIEEETGVFLVRDPFDGTRFGEDGFEPAFEWAESRAHCAEIVFALTDACAIAIFIPRHPSIDPELIRFCDTYAVPAAVPPR
jgi:hypothetical protein